MSRRSEEKKITWSNNGYNPRDIESNASMEKKAARQAPRGREPQVKRQIRPLNRGKKYFETKRGFA